MAKNLFSHISYKDFEDLVKQLNALIFDDAIWKEKWVWKLAEVTYSYDKENYVNETLFNKLWGLNEQTYNNTTEQAHKTQLLITASQKVEKIVNKKIDLINQALLKINSAEFHDITLEEALENTDDKQPIQYQLAIQFHQAKRYKEALNLLYSILCNDIGYENGDAKKTMLDLLATIDDAALVSEYRRKLYSLLY